MSTEVTLPRLGQGMESGVVVRWLKKEGDAVSKGDPLYELDTEKVTQEIEAETDGVLATIVVPEGEVAVGTTLAVIESRDGAGGSPDGDRRAETTADREPLQGRAEREEEAEASAEAIEAPAGADASRVQPPRPTPRRRPSRRASAQTPLKASPLARRIARERGVDLADGSRHGPGRPNPRGGRGEGARAEPPRLRRPPRLPPRRSRSSSSARFARRSRERLTEAWTAPVFQLGVSADMAEALALRERLVERLEEGDVKPTVNDVLVKLAAVALTRHAAVNATFTGEEIQRHPTPNVGIAVAAPQGLIVPVIRDAARLTVQQIATDARRPRRPRARQQAHVRRPRGRDVHDLEPRDVRRRAVHRRPQSAAGGDPRGRRGRRTRPSSATATSTSRRSCTSC